MKSSRKRCPPGCVKKRQSSKKTTKKSSRKRKKSSRKKRPRVYKLKPAEIDNLKKGQRRLTKIFKFFDKVCRENGIKYWLNGGTLIGAVRHKGWIPHDADIDVSMTKRDFKKLQKVMYKTKLPNGMWFQDEKTDPYYEDARNLDIWGKLRDLNLSYVDEKDHSIHNGIQLDIFVFTKKGNKLLVEKGAAPDIFDMKYSDVFPLKELKFQGFPVYVQKNYKAFLKKVYGAEVPPELPLKKCYPHEGRIGKTQKWQKEKYDWLYSKRHKFSMNGASGAAPAIPSTFGGAPSTFGGAPSTFFGGAPSTFFGGEPSTFFGDGGFGEELSRKELENKKKVNILRKILRIAVREVDKNKNRRFKKFRLKFLKDLPPDSVLGTSDCFGYKPDPRRKMLIGTIIIKDTSNGKIASLLILSYDIDYDLIDFSFMCTATRYRRLKLSTLTTIPPMIVALANPDLVNGAVASTLTRMDKKTIQLEQGQFIAPSKRLFTNKLNFSYLQLDGLLAPNMVLEDPERLIAKCSCPDFLRKNRANYQHFLDKYESEGKNFISDIIYRNYDVFLFTSGSEPLEISDLPLFRRTLDAYIA